MSVAEFCGGMLGDCSTACSSGPRSRSIAIDSSSVASCCCCCCWWWCSWCFSHCGGCCCYWRVYSCAPARILGGVMRPHCHTKLGIAICSQQFVCCLQSLAAFYSCSIGVATVYGYAPAARARLQQPTPRLPCHPRQLHRHRNHQQQQQGSHVLNTVPSRAMQRPRQQCASPGSGVAGCAHGVAVGGVVIYAILC